MSKKRATFWFVGILVLLLALVYVTYKAVGPSGNTFIITVVVLVIVYSLWEIGRWMIGKWWKNRHKKEA